MNPNAASQREHEAKVFGTYMEIFLPCSMHQPRFWYGEKVRIAKNKGIFEKGYIPHLTEEVFKLSHQATHLSPQEIGSF